MEDIRNYTQIPGLDIFRSFLCSAVLCPFSKYFCNLWQRSQITSLFGAEALWKKGYTGKKVKMAIFDTGIRADHPHFQNIKVCLLNDAEGRPSLPRFSADS